MEAYIVVIQERAEGRKASRHRLNVPVDAARGQYHLLSDRALNDLIKDMRHEQRRRSGELFDGAPPRRWDPAATQIDNEETQ